jgi:hypothetical protein
MTNHLVDTGTQRFGKSDVVEGRWIGPSLQESLVDGRIDFVRRHARLGQGTGLIQDTARQSSGDAHSLDILWFVVNQNGVSVGIDGDIASFGIGWFDDNDIIVFVVVATITTDVLFGSDGIRHDGMAQSWIPNGRRGMFVVKGKGSCCCC